MKMKLRKFLITLGAIAAFCAAIAATLDYIVPDKSSVYLTDLREHKDNLKYIVNLIYMSNREQFDLYKNKAVKMPDEQFKKIVIKALNDEDTKAKVDALVDYLDVVANCEFSVFCRVSNVDVGFDDIMYGSWYWLRPYIIEARKTYIPGFGTGLEKYAKQAKKRVDRKKVSM